MIQYKGYLYYCIAGANNDSVGPTTSPWAVNKLCRINNKVSYRVNYHYNKT